MACHPGSALETSHQFSVLGSKSTHKTGLVLSGHQTGLTFGEGLDLWMQQLNFELASFLNCSIDGHRNRVWSVILLC